MARLTNKARGHSASGASKPRLLVVEDDARLAAGICLALRGRGYEVELATNGDAGLRAALDSPPDLIVLDLLLPRRSGLEVLEALRDRSNVPILVLTALTDLQTRLKSFDLGAVDYLAKPFFTEELVARVDTRLARRPDAPRRVVAFLDVRVDLDARTVTRGNDIPIKLKPAEFNVLAYLVARPERTLTRRQIAEGALTVDGEQVGRTVDSHIARVRKKLGDAGATIETVWSVGYRFFPGAST